MTYFKILNISGTHLEAEVAPNGLDRFEARYLAATGKSVSPGREPFYQEQNNKWGAELRIYFNDSDLASQLKVAGYNVEHRNAGYLSDKFKFRVSDNDLWWEFVEKHGATLGEN